MRKIIYLLLIVNLFLLAVKVPIHAQSEKVDYEALFQGHEGTFLLYDQAHDVLMIYNPDRAGERFPPFSTFKILNAAIALETGVADGPDFIIQYDAGRYPPLSNNENFNLDTWWQDHDLQSAIQESVVWYFFEIALDIGQDRMQRWVSDVSYGNEDVSVWVEDTPFGDPRPFWLGSSLEISAFEQMQFLRGFFNEETPFSSETVAVLQDILTLEEADTYRLVGKTGTRADASFGWFVGYVETEDNLYFYVINIDSSPVFRNQLIWTLLVEHGVLPE